MIELQGRPDPPAKQDNEAIRRICRAWGLPYPPPPPTVPDGHLDTTPFRQKCYARFTDSGGNRRASGLWVRVADLPAEALEALKVAGMSDYLREEEELQLGDAIFMDLASPPHVLSSYAVEAVAKLNLTGWMPRAEREAMAAELARQEAERREEQRRHDEAKLEAWKKAEAERLERERLAALGPAAPLVRALQEQVAKLLGQKPQ